MTKLEKTFNSFLKLLAFLFITVYVDSYYIQAQESEAVPNVGQFLLDNSLCNFQLLLASTSNQISCPFAGNSSDVVTVMFSNPADNDFDFNNEVWLFDAGGDGTTNLIIVFRTVNDRALALLFDDQNNNGAVDHQLSGDSITVTESTFPTLTVTAPDGWWVRPDGTVNYNLTIDVDGLLRASFSVGDLDENGVWQSHLEDSFFQRASNGRLDWRLRIFDENQDGRPDVQITGMSIPFPPSTGVVRTEIMVNTAQNETPPVEGAVFWPYLGNWTTFVQPYNSSPAPIQMNWEQSRLWQIGEFVASRGAEDNYFIYSIAPANTVGEVNYADFENPFAFYDLANDDDGVPELQIRQAYFGPADPNYTFTETGAPLSNIRYSWDQNNDGYWDYKFHLADVYPVDTIVELPDREIYTIPYETFPDWVMDKTWGYMVFVSVEDRNYSSTEGIYEWAPVDNVMQYLNGTLNSLPTDFLDQPTTTPVGIRGQYRTLGGSPRMYFSAIDRNLHLTDMVRGVWHIDEDSWLYYRNINRDLTVDEWRYEVGGVIQRELIDTGMFLLVNDRANTTLTITPAITERSLFEVAPPRHNEDWAQINALLAEHGGDAAFSPTDFTAMAEQFGAPLAQLNGAYIEKVRLNLEDEGFRFELLLEPGFSGSGVELLRLEGLEPNRYIVEYDEVNGFRAMPYSPPNVVIGEIQVFDNSPIVENESSLLRLPIQNVGAADANAVVLSIYATQGDLQTREFQRLPRGQEIDLSLNAGDTVLREFLWSPPTAGEWLVNIDMLIVERSGEFIERTVTQAIEVEPAETVSPETLISAFGIVPMPVVILLGIAVVVVFAAGFLLIFRNVDLV